MVAKKPRIVIIGAGMAGLTAAHKLYSATAATELFELCVVEGGDRIGGRIHTSEFGGDRIEMGATWIHGIGGSPLHKIAQEIQALESDQPWERMDGFSEDPITVAEGGFQLHLSVVEPISALYRNMMEFAQGKPNEAEATDSSSNGDIDVDVDYNAIAARALKMGSHKKGLGIGSFLRRALEAYWDFVKRGDDVKGYGNWSTRMLQEAIFAMHENTERTYTSAWNLSTLDFNAESEYREFPGEQITIAKGYLSIVKSLASALPTGLIQLGRKVKRIEWQPEAIVRSLEMETQGDCRPVKLCFDDGSEMVADHVIVTVSLGVLKAGIKGVSGMFNPPLPSFKTEAISRLGFGVVNKLFLQLDRESENLEPFPFLQMVFHPPDSDSGNQKIPWWMRKTASLCPIYKNSSVLLSWFAGEEALELESLKEEQVLNGVSTTTSSFLVNSTEYRNGSVNSVDCFHGHGREIKFTRVLRSQWGSNPLFLGSYSYVAVGSSGDDLDLMAEPLPNNSNSECVAEASPPLQILFAGEATHRTHYSTTHGAYFSGLREANRLLQHYRCGGGFSELFASLEQ